MAPKPPALASIGASGKIVSIFADYLVISVNEKRAYASVSADVAGEGPITGKKLRERFKIGDSVFLLMMRAALNSEAEWKNCDWKAIAFCHPAETVVGDGVVMKMSLSEGHIEPTGQDGALGKIHFSLGNLEHNRRQGTPSKSLGTGDRVHFRAIPRKNSKFYDAVEVFLTKKAESGTPSKSRARNSGSPWASGVKNKMPELINDECDQEIIVSSRSALAPVRPVNFSSPCLSNFARETVSHSDNCDFQTVSHSDNYDFPPRTSGVFPSVEHFLSPSLLLKKPNVWKNAETPRQNPHGTSFITPNLSKLERVKRCPIPAKLTTLPAISFRAKTPSVLGSSWNEQNEHHHTQNFGEAGGSSKNTSRPEVGTVMGVADAKKESYNRGSSTSSNRKSHSRHSAQKSENFNFCSTTSPENNKSTISRSESFKSEFLSVEVSQVTANEDEETPIEASSEISHGDENMDLKATIPVNRANTHGFLNVEWTSPSHIELNRSKNSVNYGSHEDKIMEEILFKPRKDENLESDVVQLLNGSLAVGKNVTGKPDVEPDVHLDSAEKRKYATIGNSEEGTDGMDSGSLVPEIDPSNDTESVCGPWVQAISDASSTVKGSLMETEERLQNATTNYLNASLDTIIYEFERELLTGVAPFEAKCEEGLGDKRNSVRQPEARKFDGDFSSPKFDRLLSELEAQPDGVIVGARRAIGDTYRSDGGAQRSDYLSENVFCHDKASKRARKTDRVTPPPNFFNAGGTDEEATFSKAFHVVSTKSNCLEKATERGRFSGDFDGGTEISLTEEELERELRSYVVCGDELQKPTSYRPRGNGNQETTPVQAARNAGNNNSKRPTRRTLTLSVLDSEKCLNDGKVADSTARIMGDMGFLGTAKFIDELTCFIEQKGLTVEFLQSNLINDNYSRVFENSRKGKERGMVKSSIQLVEQD